MTLGDRIKESTDTTGSGPYSLRGTIATFRTFVGGIEALAGTPSPRQWTDVAYTCIQNDVQGNNVDFEMGRGTLTPGAGGNPDQLTRDEITFSTNNDLPVDWGIGTKTIVCAPQARDVGSVMERVDRQSVFVPMGGNEVMHSMFHLKDANTVTFMGRNGGWNEQDIALDTAVDPKRTIVTWNAAGWFYGTVGGGFQFHIQLMVFRPGGVRRVHRSEGEFVHGGVGTGWKTHYFSLGATVDLAKSVLFANGANDNISNTAGGVGGNGSELWIESATTMGIRLRRTNSTYQTYKFPWQIAEFY